MTHHHHHDHQHQIPASRTDISRIRLAFFLNFGFAILEVIFGLLTNSIAIMSDALHDLGDSITLAFSWGMAYVAKKKNDDRFSYGYQRFSTLGALLNGCILIFGAIFILTEAIPRLLSPQAVRADWMIVIAVVGIFINGFAALRMREGKTLNAKVVSLHLLEDVLGWVAILVVSILMFFINIPILDPILSITISLWVIVQAVRSLSETAKVFLQGVPTNLSVAWFEAKIKAIPYVKDIHHTHIWSLDGDSNVFTTHIIIDGQCNRELINQIKRDVFEMTEGFNLDHSAIEIEFEGDDCRLLHHEDE